MRSQHQGMCRIYIKIRARCLKGSQCGLTHSPFSPTPPLAHILPRASTSTTLSAPMIRCPGCDKTFTRHGLSQHISKTRRRHCRNLHRPLQTQTVFRPTPVSLAPNTSSVSWNLTDEPIGDGSACEEGYSTDSSSSPSQSHEAATDGDNEGRFFMTHNAAPH